MYKRILIDGQNMAHRMRHAHNDLASIDARPTGVLYGMLNQITYLIQQFVPDELIVVWEGQGKSWRKDFFSGYKAERDVRRDEYTIVEKELWEEFIKIQLPDTMYALRQFGVPQLDMPGWEADDTIAACCLLLKQKPGPSATENIIVSTDKDFLQLVDKNTRMFNPTTDKIFYLHDKTGELRESGVDTNDVLAPSPLVFLWRRYLIGDTSDCIPGIKGVGIKTAEKLLPNRELPGENLTRYLTRNLPKKTSVVSSRVEQAIRGIDQTLFRNERLMDLRHAMKNVDKRTLYKFWDAYALSSTGPGIRCFIKDGIEYADPNPMLAFFRPLDFDFVAVPHRWRRIVKTFRRLYESHKLLQFATEEGRL